MYIDKLVISQAEIITAEKNQIADLYISDRRIYFAKEKISGQINKIIEGQNCYVTPGLFDLQVNGSTECNLWQNPSKEQFSQLCLSMLKAGVTAFLPTLITTDFKHLKEHIELLESIGIPNIDRLSSNSNTNNMFDPIKAVVLPGIHLEGPYLSPEKPGVHPKEYVRAIDLKELAQLIRPSIKLMTLAPEQTNGNAAIEFLLAKNVIPSLGHSNASFEEADKAFKLGIPMVTHIFNALPTIHQRQPGAITAALLNKDVYCCVICDGLHVDKNMVDLLLRIKGTDKVILVSDIAQVGTTGGGLVGSSIKLSEAVANLVNWGIASFAEAIKMATFNPAKALKLEQYIGQIKEGSRADLVIWDKKSLAIKYVLANGYLLEF